MNLIKNIVKSKENEIINAKQYENKLGSINIIMGRVVCELLSTQYLGSCRQQTVAAAIEPNPINQLTSTTPTMIMRSIKEQTEEEKD